MKKFPLPTVPFRKASSYAVKAVASDCYGVVPGSGWVITLNGSRIDWPMLTNEAEARSDLADFKRMNRELASDEASEARGIALMSGDLS